jgi:protein-glucosylgalactosylhydroxylysine glucosidase
MQFIKVIILLTILCHTAHAQKIDRKKIVIRQNVFINEVDTLNSLTLGNGKFAMTMDVTGLQTFYDDYKNGIPLGTQSEWGWHSFPNVNNYNFAQTLDPLPSHGRTIPYARQWPQNSEQGQASNYFRQNPHRIHLAHISWFIKKEDGTKISIKDVKKINQKLDVWSGRLYSLFEIEGELVDVTSVVDQNEDILAVDVKSSLLNKQKLGLKIDFPYPTNEFSDSGVKFDATEQDRLSLNNVAGDYIINRRFDSLSYNVNLHTEGNNLSVEIDPNGFTFMPNQKSNQWTFTCAFTKNKNQTASTYKSIINTTTKSYEQFWKNGGMIDFSKVKDDRARELERRMILSLYLTHVNCGGQNPPQETGLTYNSWFGKPHMEMIWWHNINNLLWSKHDVTEKQLSWYFRAYDTAKKIAERQGFKGVRWQKMTDNDGGETSSSIGSYLIWQQPHIIYLADLVYTDKPNDNFLKNYYPIIEATADFMADFAYKDENNIYNLPGIIPSQERYDPAITTNPPLELAYWRYALERAQDWRKKLKMPRKIEWDNVLNHLAQLPQKNNVYLSTQTAPNCYTNERFLTDHPSVLGAYGMLPFTKGLDLKIMRNSYQKIKEVWHWNDTWGWDFPMVAMSATRLGMKEEALNALLMPIKTNTYLKNGHNYQNERLRLYLPGNSGFLAALAMMTVGTKEKREKNAGFPKEWVVKSEGLGLMP